MPVLPSVERVVKSLPEAEQSAWRAQLALQLAGSLDAAPNASMARELRSVMKEIQSESAPVEVDGLDRIVDLASRRKSASSG